jgi:hypothetical protein
VTSPPLPHSRAAKIPTPVSRNAATAARGRRISGIFTGRICALISHHAGTPRARCCRCKNPAGEDPGYLSSTEPRWPNSGKPERAHGDSYRSAPNARTGEVSVKIGNCPRSSTTSPIDRSPLTLPSRTAGGSRMIRDRVQGVGQGGRIPATDATPGRGAIAPRPGRQWSEGRSFMITDLRVFIDRFWRLFRGQTR